MITYFFLVVGAILLLYGAVSYFKYYNWKKTGKDAVAVYEELLSTQEKQAGGPFGRKTRLICKYRTEITSGGRVTHGTRMESFDTLAEAKRLVGKKLQGVKNDDGEFLDLESVDGLRKSALGKIIAGAAGLLIALAEYVFFHYVVNYL